jgi:hypothetical protein
LATEGWEDSLNEGLQPLPPTIFQQLPKALEAEEKRISPSRGVHCKEKAQTSALPFPESFGEFLSVISNS